MQTTLSPRLAQAAATFKNARALGLIRAPGDAKDKPVQLTQADAAAINGVRVAFQQITPAMAKEWLQKNTHNRRLRESTVLAYTRDMTNGDWLLNHQGIAFDSDNHLIDGQHRLEAIVRSGTTVTMLVSTGWPARQNKSRNNTMDTVDRGLNRSVADQLGLQHGMTDARYAVSYTSVVAKLCRGHQGSLKLTTGITLGVIEQFSAGLKWSVENRNNIPGLCTCGALGAMAFAYNVHPKKVAEFNEILVTGVGLTKTHPVLHVRNWLMVGEGVKYISSSASFYQACVVLNHIHRFCLEQTAEQICTSEEGLKYFTKMQQLQVTKVQTLIS